MRWDDDRSSGDKVGDLFGSWDELCIIIIVNLVFLIKHNHNHRLQRKMLKHSLLLAFAAASAQGSISHEDGASQKPMGGDYACQHPQYQTHIVSTSPLVIYIENFLSEEEQSHLLEIT